MLWWCVMALGWASVPDRVDVDNLEHWETGMNRLLDGPDGCWELVGKASWRWDFGRFGSSRGDAAFIGRIRSGEWEGFHVQSMGEDQRSSGRQGKTQRIYEDELRFAPMFGKLSRATVTATSDSDGSEVEVETDAQRTPGNILRAVLDELGTNVEWSYAQWDNLDQVVRYTRTVPLGKGARAQETDILVTFPEGGPLPNELEVVFPDAFKRGTVPRITIENAKVELRGRPYGSDVLPVAETVRFDVGVLGFNFSAGQTIEYVRATPCAASPEGR